MMFRRYAPVFLLLFVSLHFSANTAVLPGDSVNKDSLIKTKPSPTFPAIGLGAGLFTFYGDVNNRKLLLPQTSRIAYELSVSKNLTSYLNLRFYVCFGKMGANERNPGGRNLNFQSEIRMGGVNLSYNFLHLLRPKHIAEPYLTVGFESFEFLSKTDIYDRYGNKYYYWSDGSIRNLDESDPFAASAILLTRDYTYESDIREMNLDGFGKYAERSWTYTAGAGINLLLNKQMNFRIGSTMHFTMTDYVDGVTENSTGNRAGDARNDWFMMTSFTLSYSFDKDPKDINPLDTVDFSDVDFYALDLEDTDKDGVRDPKDKCNGTPSGVTVDTTGCPYDEDGDLVPDYLDKELGSAKDAIVDMYGITMDDSLIALQWRMFNDSTGEFNQKVDLGTVSVGGTNTGVKFAKKEFTVYLAQYTTGVPSDVMDKLLAIRDVKSTTLKDSSTVYSAGSFQNLGTAQTRLEELKGIFPGAKVIYIDGDKINDVNVKPNTNNNNSNNANNNNSNTNNNNNNTNNTNTNTNNNNTTTTSSGIVYRVQLGAFSKKVSKNIFRDAPDVVVVQTPDGLYKALSGSFNNLDDAKKHQELMKKLGYKDAFVVAYKDGKRIQIQ